MSTFTDMQYLAVGTPIGLDGRVWLVERFWRRPSDTDTSEETGYDLLPMDGSGASRILTQEEFVREFNSRRLVVHGTGVDADGRSITIGSLTAQQRRTAFRRTHFMTVLRPHFVPLRRRGKGVKARIMKIAERIAGERGEAVPCFQSLENWANLAFGKDRMRPLDMIALAGAVGANRETVYPRYIHEAMAEAAGAFFDKGYSHRTQAYEKEMSAILMRQHLEAGGSADSFKMPPVPDVSVFCRIVAKVQRGRAQTLRHGPTQAYLDNRSTGTGWDWEELQPFEDVQLDVTPIDYLVHDPRTGISGRPFVYSAICVATGGRLGYALTYEPESYAGLIRLLRHMTMLKVPPPKPSEDLPDLHWPWHFTGVPLRMTIDLAKMNLGHDLPTALEGVESSISFTRPGIGSDKPHVEQLQWAINGHTLDGLPSRIFKPGDKRGKKKRTNEPIVTFEELDYILYAGFCFENEMKCIGERPLPPNAMLRNAIADGYHVPMVHGDADTVVETFGKTSTTSFKKGQLKLNGFTYVCPPAAQHRELVMDGDELFVVKADPSDVSYVLLLDKRRGERFRATLAGSPDRQTLYEGKSAYLIDMMKKDAVEARGGKSGGISDSEMMNAHRRILAYIAELGENGKGGRTRNRLLRAVGSRLQQGTTDPADVVEMSKRPVVDVETLLPPTPSAEVAQMNSAPAAKARPRMTW